MYQSRAQKWDNLDSDPSILLFNIFYIFTEKVTQELIRNKNKKHKKIKSCLPGINNKKATHPPILLI